MQKLLIIFFLSAISFTKIVLANYGNNKESSKSTALKIWEATPEGKYFKKWEVSAKGRKVIESSSKIRSSINNFSTMEATVISKSLPAGSRLGFGMMVNIKGEDYILSFGPDLKKDFGQLRALNVNDIIQIKSHSISKAPKYDYPIIAGDYIEKEGKIIYKRIPNKNGC